jgi:type II secretory pathway component PulF
MLSGPERGLIRVLAIANRSSIDPGPMVLALSQEFPGRYGERLKRLGALLIEGMHVLDAVSHTPRVLDNSHLVALRLADQAGKLADMYDAILMTEITDNHDKNRLAGVGSEFFRLLVMTLLAWLILTFVSVWIVPTIEEMFEEFGIQLPEPTLHLIALSKIIPLLGVFATFLMLMYMMWNSSIAMHWLTTRFFPSRYGKSWQPANAQLRSLLALIPRLGLPIEDGLETIIKAPCGYGTKRRLAIALSRIQAGEEPWNALTKQRLILRREAAALSASESGLAEGWILDRFAERRMQNAFGRRQRHERIFAIVNTVVLGGIVAWTSVSVFMMLSELIGSLA